MFSEEKAKILRRIGAGIEEKDQELALFLTSLQVSSMTFEIDLKCVNINDCVTLIFF